MLVKQREKVLVIVCTKPVILLWETKTLILHYLQDNTYINEVSALIMYDHKLVAVTWDR